MEYNFKKEEVEFLVHGAKKIGFKPLKQFVSDNDFKPEKVKSEINFEHTRTGNVIQVYKFEIINAGLDIFSDNISDILFTLLFKEMYDKDYLDNYDPS